jgi:hypothetical protein
MKAEAQDWRGVGSSGQPDEEGRELDEADNDEFDESLDLEAPEPQVPITASMHPSASSIAQELHQPGQPPTWWDPVHLALTVPEVARPSVANTDPAGLRTHADSAEPLPPGRTCAGAVGREEQNAAVRWADVLNSLGAIGRFFIRFFGGV